MLIKKSTIIVVKKMHLLIDDACFVPLNLYKMLVDRPFYNPKRKHIKSFLFIQIENTY